MNMKSRCRRPGILLKKIQVLDPTLYGFILEMNEEINTYAF